MGYGRVLGVGWVCGAVCAGVALMMPDRAMGEGAAGARNQAWRAGLKAETVQSSYEGLVKMHGEFPAVDSVAISRQGAESAKVAGDAAREDLKATVMDMGEWFLKEFDEKGQFSRLQSLRALVATRKWILAGDGWCNVTTGRIMSNCITALLLDEMVMEESPSKEILRIAEENLAVRKQEKIGLVGSLSRELGVKFEPDLAGRGDVEFLRGLLGTVDSGMKDALAASKKGVCAVCMDRLFGEMFQSPVMPLDQFEKPAYASAMVECCTSWWGETMTWVLCQYSNAAGKIPKAEEEFKLGFMKAFPAGRGLPISFFSDASCGSDDAWQVFAADQGLVKPRIKLLAETFAQ